MALEIRASAETGLNLFARLVRQSDSLHWDTVGTSWAAQNDTNNRKALTEGPFNGRYYTTFTGLGSDQHVEVYIEKSLDVNPAVGPVTMLGSQMVYLDSGNEVPVPQPGQAAKSAKIVVDERTWFLEGGNEGHTANNIVKLVPAGMATATIAMDFSKIINPETGILSVSSATEVTANGVTISNAVVADTLQRAHIDVASVTAGTSYTIKVTITTSDNQTLSGLGILKGQV